MDVTKMSDHQCRIYQFMQKAGQELPQRPCIPSSEIRVLRAKLILEEAMETIDALGITVTYNGVMTGFSDFEFLATHLPNLVEIADGCADISVVTYGTLLACGISDEPIIEAVDESNLAKFAEGSYRREDGKWMKPPDWQKPDLFTLLLEQGSLDDCYTDDDDVCDDPTDVWEGV